MSANVWKDLIKKATDVSVSVCLQIITLYNSKKINKYETSVFNSDNFKYFHCQYLPDSPSGKISESTSV